MAVVSVEIPDIKAKNIKPFSVIKFQELEDMMYDDETWYVTLVDFWPEWLAKEDFEDYLLRNR